MAFFLEWMSFQAAQDMDRWVVFMASTNDQTRIRQAARKKWRERVLARLAAIDSQISALCMMMTLCWAGSGSRW